MDCGNITRLQFSVISPEEFIALSTTHVTESKAGAVQRSVSDPRLGPTDGYTKCATCMQKNVECPGHFGHIILAEPIFHPKYFPTIVKILKCICLKCSTPLVPRDRVELCLEIHNTKGQKRLTAMSKVCEKIKECVKCGSFANKIRCENNRIYVLNVMDKNGKLSNMVLNAKRVHEILSCISDDDVRLLGFNSYLVDKEEYKLLETMPCASLEHRHQMRPEWMIFTVFPVIPPAIRPPSYTDDLYPDDLTEKLNEIIKCNERLKIGRNKKREKLSQSDRDKLVDKLESHISTYIHNKDGTAKAGGGKAKSAARACKGVADRLGGKEGQIRHHLLSKRSDYSGRTVIGGDPTLEIDELGVPKEMAETLTIPQVVRPYNLDAITKLIREGRVNYIYNSRKERIDMRKIRGGYQNYTITEDVSDSRVVVLVHVQLQDGDPVILNRQPTLLPQSMMALKAKIMPEGRTLRFSLAICTPYGADKPKAIFEEDSYLKLSYSITFIVYVKALK